jgi:hypothetical protein
LRSRWPIRRAYSHDGCAGTIAAMTPQLGLVLEQVAEERRQQDAQWGADFDDARAWREWLSLVHEHADRAQKALPRPNVPRSGDPDDYRRQLVAIAAIAVAAVEAYDRANGIAPDVERDEHEGAGARIMALAKRHNVITADELPSVVGDLPDVDRDG